MGGIALCQVAVTLTHATGRGPALIGRALFLPEGCAADEEHRELAGVPEQVMFASKPQLADSLIDRAHYLGDPRRVRRRRRSVRPPPAAPRRPPARDGLCDGGPGQPRPLTTGSGRTVTTAAAAGMIPVRVRHRKRTGAGTKGTRHCDRAMLEVTSDGTPGGHSVLLARRHRYTGTLSLYRC